MTPTRAICSSLLLAALLATLAGCGNYTMDSQYRTGVSTVFVPIWTRGKDVYRRDLEQPLTEAIAKRIEQDTPYKVAGKDKADTELSGKIVRIEQQVLSKNPDTGLARDLEVTFTLAFTWKDLRTGKILKQHSNLRVADTYITECPIGEDFFQGREAVINRAARRVVEQMEADW